MNIRKFFGLCEHTWKQIDHLKVEAFLPSTPDKTHIVRYEYVCQCEKCGKIRTFKT